MNKFFRFCISSMLILAFFLNALPCGPAYITPVFEYKYAPDNPYQNFAAGNIGILKPSYRRIVLFAAYRYLNGGSFSADEQIALVEVWNAEFNNKSYDNENEINEAVKKWVEKRKEVAEKDEKLPDIYTERQYGGFDFFPNCTINAFETAAATLSDRIFSYGSDSGNVKNWAKAQDQVFENCASGKSTPDAANQAMPEWLQKDRAYQLAAAEFYSLDYAEAKRRFAEIAQDSNSVWQQTAEYLVGRTLIRQASLSKDESKARQYYVEAEEILSIVASKGGKFSQSAENLLGLVKYRLHPQERFIELAQKLSFSGSPNFRQDLIDFNWLADKFSKETLEAEEKRKTEINDNNSNTNQVNKDFERGYIDSNSNYATNTSTEPTHNEGDLRIYLYGEDNGESFVLYVKPEATDAEAIAEAEKIVGKPLTDKMKEQVREGRRTAYTGRFSGNSGNEYEGGYYGDEKLSRSLLPEFFKNNDLTDWLFTYQMEGKEAYLYSLSKFRQTNSDLWLATAISKADKNSNDLAKLMESANRLSRLSTAYPTIAYHQARILIEQNKNSEARQFLDEVLNSSIEIPVSSRNQFQTLRLKLSETLEDFLKFAQRKPFTFDWDGETGTIEDFIARQKSWYSPENYPDQTQAEYEAEVEKNFKNEKIWQNRLMFDYETIETINQQFPVSVLLEAEKSPALPDYLRERFALAIWTRSVILNDFVTAQKISSEVIKFHPELEKLMIQFLSAKTTISQQNAALFLILKNPVVSPFLEDGLGKSDNEFGNFDANDWWCAPYEPEPNENQDNPILFTSLGKPAFLTQDQINAAKDERKKMKEIGDAPAFMAEKVIEWQKRSPLDKRIPESLFIVFQANGWTKYGCGSNLELREKIGNLLKRKYPESSWVQKMAQEDQ